MKSLMKKICCMTLTVLALFLVVGVDPSSLNAEGENTVRTNPNSYDITSKPVIDVYFDGSKMQSETITTSGVSPTVGDTYTATYPGAINYFGTPLDLDVQITYKGNSNNPYKDIMASNYSSNKITKMSGGVIRIGSFGADYDVSITVSGAGSESFKAGFFIVDPDQENILMDGLTTKNVYFIDAMDSTNIAPHTVQQGVYLADYYEIKDDTQYGEGFYRMKYAGTNNDADDNSFWVGFENGRFGIEMGNTIQFTVQGRADNLEIPDFFYVEAPYEVQYYYEKEGQYSEQYDAHRTDVLKIYEKVEDAEGNVSVIAHSSIDVTDNDKKHNILNNKNGYVLDETSEGQHHIYSLDLTQDGVTEKPLILKVYFKEQFRVTYHDDLNQTVFTDVEKTDYNYNDPTEKYAPQDGIRKGYTFEGWRDKDGNVLKPDEVAGKPVTEDTDYYAVWKAINYTIKYWPNYDGFNGTYMEDDTYVITDPAMKAKEANEWSYTRDGYKFLGYSVENKNGTLVPVNDADFAHDFIDTLPDETDHNIDLFAQWTPVYTIKYDPNYEDFSGTLMEDDIYYGTDDSMKAKKEWSYTRNGFKFIGYAVEDKDGNLVPVGSADFAHDFIDMLPNETDRLVILYAQWEKLPVVPYALPVTGVE